VLLVGHYLQLVRAGAAVPFVEEELMYGFFRECFEADPDGRPARCMARLLMERRTCSTPHLNKVCKMFMAFCLE
jgi:hypothetical protein